MRLIAAVLLATSAVAAQAPPSFDAASIKLNTSGDWRKSIGPAPGGRFIATNNTLRDLIPFAYALPQATAAFRISGGPKWIGEERYDVTARVDGSWTPQQTSDMLRALLADRFKLVVHRETRELPIYVLTIASTNGHLRPSEIDQGACDDALAVGRPRDRRPHAGSRSG